MIETGILMVVALIATLIIVLSWRDVMKRRRWDKMTLSQRLALMPIYPMTKAMTELGMAAQRASVLIAQYGAILAKIEERHDA